MTPHNNVGFSDKCSENMATEIITKSPVLATPLLFKAPSPQKHHEYPREPYIA